MRHGLLAANGFLSEIPRPYSENPSYTLLKEEGPNHNKVFTIEVLVDNISYGIGEGKNKKTAEQNAAQDALVKIGEHKQ